MKAVHTKSWVGIRLIVIMPRGQVRCRQVCREPKGFAGQQQPLSPSYIKVIIQHSFVHEKVLKILIEGYK